MRVGILVCQVKLVPNYREENTSQKLSSLLHGQNSIKILMFYCKENNKNFQRYLLVEPKKHC